MRPIAGTPAPLPSNASTLKKLLTGKDRGEYVYARDAQGFTLTGLSSAGKPRESYTSLVVEQ